MEVSIGSGGGAAVTQAGASDRSRSRACYLKPLRIDCFAFLAVDISAARARISALHAEIVAREFGIPLADEDTDAIRVITKGSKIVLHGRRGSINL